MGALPLENRLRARLAAVLVPLVAAVAVAAVALTSHALTAADDARALSIARSVAQTVRVELGEGDTLDQAVHESTASFDAREVKVFVGMAAPAPVPPDLPAALAGTCASVARADLHGRVCRGGDASMDVVVLVRTDAHVEVVRTLAEWMLALVVAAVLGALLAARFALRAPLESLVQLARWADQASPAALTSPPAGGTLEIDRLSSAFERLLTQLLDVLARERASSAHVAHELRTPLTAMTAELAAMPSTPGDAVSRLRADAARLTRVIDAILLLARPAGDRRSETVVNVADVVRKLAPKGAIVRAPDEALVEAEPHLVELAIENLLENAAKYAPAGARAVTVTREAELVRVGVVDGGAAPEARVREQMFERYWRETDAGAGSGLGLALVRAVAQRHGGDASARDARGDGDGDGELAGLEVGFTMGPILGWHDGPPDAA